MEATTCNPLLRTPLSLIVDDSCPVINLAYYWMKQRHGWKARHQPGVAPDRWEGDPDRVDKLPHGIPADFARKWGEWCAEQGIRGKFSFIPFPAGQGRIDQGFPEFPPAELDAWLDVAHNVLSPNFDLTPEILTHTHVADPKTWTLTEEWEQVEWVDPPVEPLTDYIAAAFQLLKNVGIAAEGVTSPGAFGKKKEAAYARAILDASIRVNGNPQPFYFLRHEGEALPTVPIWIPLPRVPLPRVPLPRVPLPRVSSPAGGYSEYLLLPSRGPGSPREGFQEEEKGEAIASVITCAGDWFGGWTGWDAGDPDRFITADLQGGRLPAVLAAERACVMVGHWPGFYFNGEEFGFNVLKEVKRRLDAYDPDGTKTIWMKNSEIGHYQMARELSTVVPEGQEIRVETRFPTPHFTLRLDDLAARSVRVAGRELRPVQSRAGFKSGTFLVEGSATCLAFDLSVGEIRIVVTP